MIRHGGTCLDAADAAMIARQAWGLNRAKMVLIDLRRTTKTCTAALAKLILLRSRLLKAGRDLRIVGLRGRAEALYQITRMQGILPRRLRPRRPRPKAHSMPQYPPPALPRPPGRGKIVPTARPWRTLEAARG